MATLDANLKEAKASKSVGVQVLGPWNFTLQVDTPLYWLRCGALDHYLMKARVRTPCPSTVGVVIHSEADSSGMEGVSFWIERTPEGKRYFLAGTDLDSSPVVTRMYPDSGVEATEVFEVMMQGVNGCIFLRDRVVKIKFVLRRTKGSLAFYNTSKGDTAEAHFSNVQVTNLSKAAPELTGMLASREKAVLEMDKEPKQMPQTADFGGIQEEGELEAPTCDDVGPDYGQAGDSDGLTARPSPGRRGAPRRRPPQKEPPRPLRLPMVPAPHEDKRMQRFVPALKARKMQKSFSEGALRRTANDSISMPSLSRN